jgi:hypothetical protein
MSSSGLNLIKAFGIAALGVAIGVGGVLLGEWDDAPGASLGAILLMLGSFVLAVRIARRKT